MAKNFLAPLPDIDEETLEKLREYALLLLKTNERVRLIGPRDFDTLWNDHIADCLRVLPLLPEKGKAIDVGTGGGLPGAVLAICRHNLEWTLLDSLSRKTKALAEIVATLGLSNATVVCARSEDFARDNRERYTVAAVRAVSEAGVIAEYLSPLVRVGGRLIAMKGPAVFDEVAPVSGKWNKLGLSQPRILEYDSNGRAGCMTIWEKNAHCASAFPRRPGMAEKKRWWM